MAKRNITIYECDLCKKDVKNEKDLTSIKLPCFENGEYYFWDDSFTTIDCCNDCTEKIARLLVENIGYYDPEEDELIRK